MDQKTKQKRSKAAEKKPDKNNTEQNKNLVNIIKYPLSTEKSLRLMEAENKLIFVVDIKATKKDIKQAAETLFKAKVTNVNTFITTKSEKRAYVQFSKETPALDIATNLGVM